MGDKIYVIIQGAYSNWRINGYALTEDEAKSVCNFYNQNKLSKCQVDDWYYLSVNKIETATSESRIFKKHRVNVSENDFSCYGYDCEDVVLKEPPAMEIKHDEDGDFISVYLEQLDTERAKKIAQDFFYKNLAEQEGIT